MVGSYARGTNREDSDLDLCIITADKEAMAVNPEFIKEFGMPEKMRTEEYGACTSVRVWYKDGLEVEFGLVEPAWLSLPLDEGTRRVLWDGYKVIVDKKGYFRHLELR